MESFSKALYNERRNAIPSWQGYHYQAMVAICKYLEYIWDVFENKKDVPKQAIVKIEWLEDFVIEDNGKIEEIYQVKKTLTNTNRKEILQNFILQYKLSGQKDTKWKIVFDEPKQCDPLSETEFEQIYKEYIEKKFIFELRELEGNIDDADHWKNNLNLTNQKSKLKTVRSYMRKWIETKGYQYNSLEERQCICNECIKVVCEKLVRQNNDYTEFNKNLEFLSCPINSLGKKCQDLIEKLSESRQGAEPYMKRNKSLSETEILDKLYCKIYNIMMSLKSKSEGDKFFLSLQNLEDAFVDAENTNYKWEKILWDKREKFLDKIKKYICDKCTTNNGEYCEDEDCVFGTIKDWDMKEIIDNMSLDFPKFDVKDPCGSISNKISVDRLDFLQLMFEDYQRDLKLLDRRILEFKDKNIFLSSIISGSRGNIKKDMKTNIMNNFLEHVVIYKDYDKILTKEFQEEIQQKEIKGIIKNIETKEEENPSFMDISTVSFITEVE